MKYWLLCYILHHLHFYLLNLFIYLFSNIIMLGFKTAFFQLKGYAALQQLYLVPSVKHLVSFSIDCIYINSIAWWHWWSQSALGAGHHPHHPCFVAEVIIFNNYMKSKKIYLIREEKSLYAINKWEVFLQTL